MLDEKDSSNNKKRYHYFSEDELKFLNLHIQSLGRRLNNFENNLEALKEKQNKIDKQVSELIADYSNFLLTKFVYEALLDLRNHYKDEDPFYDFANRIYSYLLSSDLIPHAVVKTITKVCQYSYCTYRLRKTNKQFYDYVNSNLACTKEDYKELIHILPSFGELLDHCQYQVPILATAPIINRTAQLYNPYEAWYSSTRYGLSRLTMRVTQILNEWNPVVFKTLLPQLINKQKSLLKRKNYLSENIVNNEYQLLYKNACINQRNASNFLHKNSLYQKKVEQKLIALNQFYNQVASHAIVPVVKPDSTPESLNKVDTYNKSCLAIWQEMYRVQWELEILQHESKNIACRIHSLPEDPYQEKLLSIIKKKKFIENSTIFIENSSSLLNVLLSPIMSIARDKVDDKYQALQIEEVDRRCREEKSNMVISLARYHYIEDLSNNFNNAFGKDHELTKELENTRQREEKFQYAMVEDTKALVTFTQNNQLQHFTPSYTSQQFINFNKKSKKNFSLALLKEKQLSTIATRLTFIKNYIEYLTEKIARQKNYLTFLEYKNSSQDDIIEGDLPISDQNQSKATITMVLGLIKRYETMLVGFQLEEITLGLQCDMLKDDNATLRKIDLFLFYEGSYTRQGIVDSMSDIMKKRKNIIIESKAFQERMTTLREKAQYNVIIANSPALQSLISIESSILNSSLSSCYIDLKLLKMRLQDLEHIIEQRKQLAQAACIATRLICSVAIGTLVVVSSASGPFALVFIPAVKAACNTLASKAVEDFVMNGGNLSGFENDFFTKDTLIQIGKSSAIDASTAFVFKVIPLKAQRVFPKKFKKKISKWCTSLAGGKNKSFFHKAMQEAVKEFSHDILGIVVGEAMDTLVEKYTKKEENIMNPNKVDFNDLQSDQLQYKSRLQKLRKRIGKAALNALIMGFVKPITSLLGDWYRERKNSSYSQGGLSWQDYLLHKGGHAVLGGTLAGLNQMAYGNRDLQSLKTALISGSLGAAIGEAAAEYYFDNIVVSSLMKVKDGQKIDPEEFKKFYYGEINKAVSVGKLASISTCYLLGQDIKLAYQAACNSIDNNFAATAGAAAVVVPAVGVVLVVYGTAIVISETGKAIIKFIIPPTEDHKSMKKEIIDDFERSSTPPDNSSPNDSCDKLIGGLLAGLSVLTSYINMGLINNHFNASEESKSENQE